MGPVEIPDQRTKRVHQFYTELDGVLERLWGGPSRMIHFGFYPDGTAKTLNHHDSLIETVRQAAMRLRTQPGQKILDAGCGVGGAAVFVSKVYDVQVHGITNLKLHVNKATEYARQFENLQAGTVDFLLRDYTDTGFQPDSYDGVYAIESVCYAFDKLAFLKEMYRLLRPGGRLVVLDAFRTKRDISSGDERLMQSWMSGWGATDIDTVAEFGEKARMSGFTEVQFEDLQANFYPSHYLCYRIARFVCPGAWLLNRVGLISGTMYGYCRAARDAWLAAKRSLCLEGIFSATKPTH